MNGEKSRVKNSGNLGGPERCREEQNGGGSCKIWEIIVQIRRGKNSLPCKILQGKKSGTSWERKGLRKWIRVKGGTKDRRGGLPQMKTKNLRKFFII